MELISTRETAERWGVSQREVQRLISAGRIAGAVKCGSCWMLPANEKKPPDPRRARGKKAAPEYLPYVFLSSAVPMPEKNAEGALNSLASEGQRAQYAAELSYMRGDFETALSYAEGVADDADTYIAANAIAASSAISLGDYGRYTAAAKRLRELRDARPESAAARTAEAALATGEISMFAPENAPEWLRRGELSAFPSESRPWLCYLYAKLLQNKKDFSAMLGASSAALALISRPGSFTAAEIYLLLLAAAASTALDDAASAREYLTRAMDTALPHGLIIPFAETITAYGGELERALKSRWPQYHDAVLAAAETGVRRWMDFHNRFARDNVTLLLTLREYHLALLLAKGVSYAEAARRMETSVGRVNNMASVIYEKLYIRSRRELSSFLL